MLLYFLYSAYLLLLLRKSLLKILKLQILYKIINKLINQIAIEIGETINKCEKKISMTSGIISHKQVQNKINFFKN